MLFSAMQCVYNVNNEMNQITSGSCTVSKEAKFFKLITSWKTDQYNEGKIQ